MEMAFFIDDAEDVVRIRTGERRKDVL